MPNNPSPKTVSERLYKYCLSYDVIDSEKIKKDKLLAGDGLKKLIVQTLKESGASNFKNPTASTITFTEKSVNPNYNKWHKIVKETLGEYIYYYFCSVTIKPDLPNGFMNNSRSKESLTEEFKELLEELKTNPFPPKGNRLK